MLVMVMRWRRWVGIVEDDGCERVGFGVVDHAQIDLGKYQQSIWAWLGIVCVVVGGSDSVPLNSGNSFLPGDSRNHSSAI